MSSKYRDEFFDQKRPWSVYKDSVLDYYLFPYLEHVKRIPQPVIIVDMFAGRGEFKSGEPGSPLIIARRLEKLNRAGTKVGLLCFESHDPFREHLQTVLQPFRFAEVRHQDFLQAIDDPVEVATRNTVLLYVDPCEI
jgi:three-Cys-motif partner protein